MAFAMWNDVEGDIVAAPQRRQPADQAVLDLSHLRRFTLGDRALEDEVLALFEQQALETVAALTRTTSAKEWAMATHTIKGSARAVGAFEVSTLAERLEKCGPASTATQNLIDEITAALERARRLIAANRQATGRQDADRSAVA